MQPDDPNAQTDGDISPDREERIQDFLARHGGAGATPRRDGKNASGDGGWYDVYAADGYRLHGEWSRVGSLEELKFSEVAPPGR
jgi:hypothetical protein